MPPTLVPSMIACSFPYQDKQAFIKMAFLVLLAAAWRLRQPSQDFWKILGSDNVSVQQSRKGCTGSRGSLRTERKESAAKCPDLRSASQNYKAVQNITNYLKSEIKKKPKKTFPHQIKGGIHASSHQRSIQRPIYHHRQSFRIIPRTQWLKLYQI